MAQFLSDQWFAQLESAQPAGQPSDDAGSSSPGHSLVVEICVAGAPRGAVRYQVVVEGERAWVVPPGAQFRPPHVRLQSDFATMSAIASGAISTVEALSLGKARLTGETGALSFAASRLAGLDLLPAPLRAVTTF